MPCYLTDHLPEKILAVLISFSSIKRKLFFLDLIVFFRELFISYAVLLPSEIEAKETVMAIAAIIGKCHITAILQIETIDTLIAFFCIDHIDAPFTLKTKYGIKRIFALKDTIGIAIIFTPYTTMTQVTIAAMPPIIAEFTILIIES